MAGKKVERESAKTTKAPKGGKAAAGKPARGAGASGSPFPASALAGTYREHEPLVRHTTYRIGGPARHHFTPATIEAVVGALAWAKEHKVPWLVLGLGSNVLIRDGGWPGLVLKIGKGLDSLSHRAGIWKVGGGLPIPLLARKTAEEGFSGIHRLIGVPGSVGGGVYMNAGAHGNDFASVLVSATVVQPNGAVQEVPRAKIPFTYRRSGLGEGIVLGCVLRLDKDDPAKLKAEIAELLRRRKAGTVRRSVCWRWPTRISTTWTRRRISSASCCSWAVRGAVGLGCNA